MYSADNIADFFLSKINSQKGDTISPLKLQKLVYYAQAWHYTIFGHPLFEEPIEAWMNGPVTPSLFRRFASTPKYSAIDLSSHEINPIEFTATSNQLLTEVFMVYGDLSASYLEELTHSEPPWILARGNALPHQYCNTEITLDSMLAYYSTFNGEQQQTS